MRAVVAPAFEARPPLDPPAAALSESVTSWPRCSRARRAAGAPRGRGRRRAGARPEGHHDVPPPLRRAARGPRATASRRCSSTRPSTRRDGFDDLTVVAREELPRDAAFWERPGFREIRRDSPNVELRRPLRTFLFDAPDAEAMREIGRALAGQLRAGDLVVLSGELGAGKTTFTQGIGQGLEVRGDITSPTFVIAREHPSLVGGPGAGPRRRLPARRHRRARRPRPRDLAGRLGDGRGVGRGRRRGAGRVAARGPDHPRPGRREHADLDPRRVLMTPIGPRWYEMEVPVQPAAAAGGEAQREPPARLPPLPRGRARPSSTRHPAAAVADGGRARRPGGDGPQRWRDEWELPGGDDRRGRDARARPRSGSSSRRPACRRRRGVRRRRHGPARPRAAHRVRRGLPHRLDGAVDFGPTTRSTSVAWWDSARSCPASPGSTRTWRRVALGDRGRSRVVASTRAARLRHRHAVRLRRPARRRGRAWSS